MSIAAPPAARSAVTDTAWLSQLRLNTANRAVRHDLRDVGALHRRVMRLLPDDLGDRPRSRAGTLFRLEVVGEGPPILLVQSLMPVDPARLPLGYADVRTKDMTALLTALRPGVTVRYRLVGNTVRRCGRNSTAGRWKQATPLHGEDADHWWVERASVAGLVPRSILSDPVEPLVAWQRADDRATASAPDRGKPPGSRHDGEVRVPHHATRFDGVATVHDAEALRNALLHGIGRAKSYGCGLLSIAPSGPAA
ncbi:type I-E CRISPR-associated protein Cas6/Cse3/CasE [Streptomyces sp. RFCAC02]|uniref:type I-E CRISPR-associated protein Cas6/Cse3/CasE n=1 Tax=Streptomyces sp. RFCAC02 TaxID=2499143 RepID=UPI00101EECCC|nr:type I-E CRISPR-associated protein Cas6/Cse3/CasE [Streptomyces sp. RFCAC02]